MKNKVFFDLVLSLDGFIAPDGMDMDHAHDPAYKQWMHKWAELQKWVFPLKFFRQNLRLGDGGETGPDNDLLEATFQWTGANIMGKRMFAGGEQFWPEEAPFHTPVFVLTHEVRPPWERPGGTTFYFVNDGIESALQQARSAAGDRDIRIAGGANIIQQFLNAGLIDEFTLHYSPVFFGEGLPLFHNINADIKVRITETITSQAVTHVTYAIDK
jgi:dihydrofolate reductase